MTGSRLPFLSEDSLHGDDASRYEVLEELGAGSYGTVYAVHDRDLQRVVAIKVLDASIAADQREMKAFISEARTVAALDHPGIVPIYDLQRGSGTAWFAMKRIQGQTLASALADAGSTRHPALSTPAAIVLLVLKICDALAAAHARGLVHRDVKPDNILLGEFGEVMLADWGLASRSGGSGTHEVAGTPLYMSPEQARGDKPDFASDIYALGATAFESLCGRPPLPAGDADWWDRKRAGEIDSLTRDERQFVGPGLCAILDRALAADPAQRYADIGAFAADLRAYLDGNAISAYAEPWPRRMVSWCWRRRLVLAWGTGAALAILVPVLLLVGEQLKQYAAWGAPILVEDFQDESWRSRWQPTAGSAFAVRDGRLVSASKNHAVAFYKRQLSGSVALEFEGEMLSGSTPCDLSVLWLEGTPTAATTDQPARGWMIQAGAFANSFCAIYRCQDGERTQVARAPIRLDSGRSYRIRAELDGTRIRLLIDGQPCLDYENEIPVAPGHPAIYGYFPGKAFDHVALQTRKVPEKVGILAIGDAYAQDGQWARAAERYVQAAESHPDTALADAAWYRAGVSSREAGDLTRAWQAWDRITVEPFRPLVDVEDLDRRFAQGGPARGDHLDVRQSLPLQPQVPPAARAQMDHVGQCPARPVFRQGT